MNRNVENNKKATYGTNFQCEKLRENILLGRNFVDFAKIFVLDKKKFQMYAYKNVRYTAFMAYTAFDRKGT